MHDVVVGIVKELIRAPRRHGAPAVDPSLAFLPSSPNSAKPSSIFRLAACPRSILPRYLPLLYPSFLFYSRAANHYLAAGATLLIKGPSLRSTFNQLLSETSLSIDYLDTQHGQSTTYLARAGCEKPLRCLWTHISTSWKLLERSARNFSTMWQCLRSLSGQLASWF